MRSETFQNRQIKKNLQMRVSKKYQLFDVRRQKFV